jgi:DDE family transposase
VRERSKDGAPKEVLLDFDATADPAHGDQEGSYYHGYFEEHIYHPPSVFDGHTGRLITALLRAGNTHASRATVSILKRVVGLLRAAWPGVRAGLRADAGFAAPEIHDYCEQGGIDHTTALITNARLEGSAAPLLEEAQERYEVHQRKVKPLSEGRYQALGWEKERRVIHEAEVMEEGQNTRFLVTNKPHGPKELCDHHTERGETENRTKDSKSALKADRLSCRSFLADQFRLLLHAAAYWLMDTLRKEMTEAGVRRMQSDTLRLSLIKIGGRVRELLTKVRLHLASGHPGQRLWDILAPRSATVS